MNEIASLYEWIFGQMELIYFRELKRLESLRKANHIPATRLNFNRPITRPMRSVNRNR